jgi:hypothetical protein
MRLRPQSRKGVAVDVTVKLICVLAALLVAGRASANEADDLIRDQFGEAVAHRLMAHWEVDPGRQLVACPASLDLERDGKIHHDQLNLQWIFDRLYSWSIYRLDDDSSCMALRKPIVGALDPEIARMLATASRTSFVPATGLPESTSTRTRLQALPESEQPSPVRDNFADPEPQDEHHP